MFESELLLCLFFLSPVPLLPAAATTTAPATSSAPAAASTAGDGRSVPTESDTTAGRTPAASRAATQSSPATSAPAVALPSHATARTATSVAFLATPEAAPAARAATWVPWPKQSPDEPPKADHPCSARDAPGEAPGGAAPGRYRNSAWSVRTPWKRGGGVGGSRARRGRPRTLSPPSLTVSTTNMVTPVPSPGYRNAPSSGRRRWSRRSRCHGAGASVPAPPLSRSSTASPVGATLMTSSSCTAATAGSAARAARWLGATRAAAPRKTAPYTRSHRPPPASRSAHSASTVAGVAEGWSWTMTASVGAGEARGGGGAGGGARAAARAAPGPDAGAAAARAAPHISAAASARASIPAGVNARGQRFCVAAPRPAPLSHTDAISATESARMRPSSEHPTLVVPGVHRSPVR